METPKKKTWKRLRIRRIDAVEKEFGGLKLKKSKIEAVGEV